MLTRLLNQTESSTYSCSLKITADWESTRQDQTRASCLHPAFHLLSWRWDQANGFKAQLRDTEGTSPSVSAGDGFGNTRPAVRRSFWRPCEATPLGGCRPAVPWCNNPPHPRGGAVVWAPAALGRPPLNSSSSHVAAQPFYLKQQADLSSCPPPLDSF